MIHNEPLEYIFKSIYQRTNLKVLKRLAKKGKSDKGHKNIRKYFLERIKDGDINSEDVYDFMKLYNLANVSLIVTQSKLAKITTKLFIYYLKEIKLPNSSLGLCLGEFYVVGTQYIENMSELIQNMQVNDRVNVVSESDNPYDNRAVKIQTTDGMKLGYLAKQINYIPSYILNNGKSILGVIKKLEWREESYIIKIMLYCEV